MLAVGPWVRFPLLSYYGDGMVSTGKKALQGNFQDLGSIPSISNLISKLPPRGMRWKLIRQAKCLQGNPNFLSP